MKTACQKLDICPIIPQNKNERTQKLDKWLKHAKELKNKRTVVPIIIGVPESVWKGIAKNLE